MADKGCDADWLPEALLDRGIKPCILSPSARDKPVQHDRQRYERRHGNSNMSGYLKNGHRVAMRLDLCLKVFLSAITSAAAVMFWL
ncbi:hypothetical protein [Rubellimicrobium roseum]|uniref:Transposase n=1 Tax=Rubellimicrobium roseum TaxID=687525 RepID=A0A5C4N7X5_9RHOB|nr:hypothetical protein [Rubellimicrobium roseum]TNC59692.1 hypothetical protein FHG71_22570 [Rubellimicrobium roseum]